jgi:uncharacterized protein
MQRRPSEISRRGFLRLASAGAVASFGFAEIGFAEAQSLPGIRRVTLTLPHLPSAWDNLLIVQVSDVHAGPYMPPARMRRIRDLVARIPADLIVFTGDQMDRRESDAPAFVKGFSGLSAPLGVFGILGNHDHYIDPALSVRALRRSGITPLINNGLVLERSGQRLALVGIDDLAASGASRADFSVLRRYPNAFRLCLCHQPQGWYRALHAGAHLTLAGHTHGGQIAVPTRNLNVARLRTRFIAGPYRRDDAFLYVSRGIGVGAVPVRVGAPPEIDVITLRSSAAALTVAA